MFSGLIAISLLQISSALTISLQANQSIAQLLQYDDVIYFQPESPSASAGSCSDQCLCPTSGQEECVCGVEMGCGGAIPLDLSSGGDELTFVWNAPENTAISVNADFTMYAEGHEDSTQWITDGGDFASAVAFRARTPDCQSEYQNIKSSDITFKFDDGGIGHEQKYTFLANKQSFVELDSECGIYMYMRFEPTVHGILSLMFQKLTISVNYDSQLAAQGERTYEWSTATNDIWIREPFDGSIEIVESTTSITSATDGAAASEPAATTTSTEMPKTTTTIAESTTTTNLESTTTTEGKSESTTEPADKTTSAVPQTSITVQSTTKTSGASESTTLSASPTTTASTAESTATKTTESAVTTSSSTVVPKTTTTTTKESSTAVPKTTTTTTKESSTTTDSASNSTGATASAAVSSTTTEFSFELSNSTTAPLTTSSPDSITATHISSASKPISLPSDSSVSSTPPNSKIVGSSFLILASMVALL